MREEPRRRYEARLTQRRPFPPGRYALSSPVEVFRLQARSKAHARMVVRLYYTASFWTLDSIKRLKHGALTRAGRRP